MSTDSAALTALTFYIQDRGRKLFDERGTPVLVAGAMVDITERKRAEETIRKGEEDARRQLALVEAIYATAPVGLCFVDTEQRFLSINKHLAEINGKPWKSTWGARCARFCRGWPT